MNDASEDAASAVANILGEGGLFARRLAGFEPRGAQVAMANAVADALEYGRHLVAEAGTGTGKTFAYLVPALTSGRRVLISTGTKNLQDQLFFRDLPRVREVIGASVRVSLLKGRANYVCLYRLRQAAHDPKLHGAAGVLHELTLWAGCSERGELSEAGARGASEALLPRITSSADNCLGSRCPDFGDCFVVQARRAAQAADLTVVNHHLLLADLSLKQQGFGEILPGSEAVIIDEAHQLPDLAARFFGTRVSSRQLVELARDCVEEANSLADAAEIIEACDALAAATVALEEAGLRLSARVTTEQAFQTPGFASAASALGEELEALNACLKVHAPRGPGIEACAERAATVVAGWGQVSKPADTSAPLSLDDDVRWVEPLARGVALHSTPLQATASFQALMARAPATWIFTSATLNAGDEFAAFRTQLGLVEADTIQLQSPFDYAAQARMHLPQGLPDPNDGAYPEAVAESLWPLIEASGGGAFVLCTSHRAMQRIAATLRRFVRDRPEIPLLVQGDEGKAELLNRFAAAGDAVLVATASFWEGVDVRGQSLRLLAIDRLPFAAPGDPVYEARLAAIRRAGGNPFFDEQLPRAITSLRQGIGRLIRDPADQGLLVLCDPRLSSKSYGSRVLSALPEMPMVGREEALEWLRELPRR